MKTKQKWTETLGSGSKFYAELRYRELWSFYGEPVQAKYPTLASTVLCVSYLFDTFMSQPKPRVGKDPEHISAPDTWSESSPTAL